MAKRKSVVLLVVPEMTASFGEGRLQYLFDDEGVLHFLPSPSESGSSLETKSLVLETVLELMEAINGPGAASVAPDEVMNSIEGVGQDLFSRTLPKGLQEHLLKLASNTAKNKIILYVNGPEWIPWELMHDGTDFLGASFQIARLPVRPASEGYVTYDVDHRGQVLRAERVASVLGKGALTDEQFPIWQQTFSGMSLLDTHLTLLPPSEESGPKVADLMKLFKEANSAPDILHVTCHGDRPIDSDGKKVEWTLDPWGQAFRFNIGISEIKGLCNQAGFKSRRPLVFGNACYSVVDANREFPSFAGSFLEGGASAFIGTIAPISNQVATDFAVDFYRLLLKQKRTVGEALLETKRGFMKKAGKDPSWLFYCLYGSPLTRYTLAV